MNETTSQKLQFQRLDARAILPTRGSENAAGLDLYAIEDCHIAATKYVKVPTGLAVLIPNGFYGRIAPRSGLAAKHGLHILAGVVDSDYRGEIICVVSNLGQENFIVKAGDRIAQFVIEQIILPEPVWVEGELPKSIRGDGGLGSTGY